MNFKLKYIGNNKNWVLFVYEVENVCIGVQLEKQPARRIIVGPARSKPEIFALRWDLEKPLLHRNYNINEKEIVENYIKKNIDSIQKRIITKKKCMNNN